MLTKIAISLGTKVFHSCLFVGSRSCQFFGTNRIPPQHVSHPGLCDLADLAVEQLNLKVPHFRAGPRTSHRPMGRLSGSSLLVQLA
jgi:hypothetical protein